MKLGKNFYWETLPLIGLTAAATGVAVGSISKHQVDTDKIIIADQKVSLGALQSKYDLCAAEKAKPSPCCIEGSADCSAEQNLLASADMHACSELVDATALTTMRRNSCETARKIHTIIDAANAHCTDALNLAQSPEDKQNAEALISRLQDLLKNPRISPPPCRLNEK